ncbi:hypothetical protein ACWGNE_02390 [Streptomyces xiamenensis]
MRPQLIGVIALAAAVLVGMSIATGDRGGGTRGGDGTPPVVYRITGSGASKATVDHMMPGGSMVWTEARPLLADHYRWAEPGERLYVWAVLGGDGTISCEIVVEGEVIVTETTEGEKPSVVCDAEMPRHPARAR